MSNSPQPKTWRDVLPVHPAADLFPPIPEAELKELAGDIEAHGLQTRVVVWNPSEDPDDEDKYLLLDGRSRLDALALLGLLHVDQHGAIHLNKSWNGKTWLAYETPFELLARHRDGDDPYALALSLNLHRRHLTTEQKRELIAKLLKAKPEQSDRQIANQIKASPTTVGKIRKESEDAGDVSKLDTRTDTKGREQPSTKPKQSAKPAAKPPKNIIELDRSDYSEVSATSEKPTSPPKTDPIGSSPVRYSEVPATSVCRLSATAHFLINDISRQLKEADGKLSAHDRTEVVTRIRALVDPDYIVDDIIGEALRLVEKMTVFQQRDFIARFQKRGFVVACAQGSAEIPIEQRKTEHVALDDIADDLSIPAFMRRSS
jgi:ParB-like chromosome segregation protein Spo0J